MQGKGRVDGGLFYRESMVLEIGHSELLKEALEQQAVDKA